MWFLAKYFVEVKDMPMPITLDSVAKQQLTDLDRTRSQVGPDDFLDLLKLRENQKAVGQEPPAICGNFLEGVRDLLNKQDQQREAVAEMFATGKPPTEEKLLASRVFAIEVKTLAQQLSQAVSSVNALVNTTV
jgi:hypothetical protein